MSWNFSLSVHENEEYFTSMQKAWTTYIENGEVLDKKIRPEILNSWERSIHLGVDPFQSRTKKALTQFDTQNKREINKTLLSMTIPSVENLSASLAMTETIISVTDQNGIILNSFGDKPILEKGEKTHHLPGGVWSEEVAGTNAIGTVIKTKKPAYVLFFEHFSSGWQDWYCAAAPILNPITSELLGVFNLCGKNKNFSPHTLSLAISQANLITKNIEKNLYNYGLQNNPYLVATLNSFNVGVIIIDRNKNIIKINEQAQYYFKTKAYKYLTELESLNDLVDIVLSGTEKQLEKEIPIGERNHLFRCSFNPIKQDGVIIGVVMNIQESTFNNSRKDSNIYKLSNQISTVRYNFDQIIGSDKSFLKTVNQAKKAAKLNANLFITGETGTGKEVVAQAIHDASERKNKPFIAINCGAIPPELIESELFGYEGGAFTGAKSKGSPGKFELAQGGTIFLDEIGDMPLKAQIRLLRVLEERAITRIGGRKVIPVDIRVISATHKNLKEEMQKNNFREDLYYRLCVIQLKIPPLRERSSDIPLLVNYFTKLLSSNYLKNNVEINELASAILSQYQWPGNIRELKNVVEQALFNMKEDKLLPSDLPDEIIKSVDNSLNMGKEYLLTVLNLTNGDIERSAEKLGVSRATMYRKIKAQGISVDEFREPKGK